MNHAFYTILLYSNFSLLDLLFTKFCFISLLRFTHDYENFYGRAVFCLDGVKNGIIQISVFGETDRNLAS